jgi:hypothetical protein
VSTQARLWHPWLRIERVLRSILRGEWDDDAWSQIRPEIRRVFAERAKIRRAGWFN